MLTPDLLQRLRVRCVYVFKTQLTMWYFAGIAAFFTVMTVAEGGGRRAVYHKLRDMYVPTLKANFMVWPAVQVINFRLMPVQFQLVCI